MEVVNTKSLTCKILLILSCWSGLAARSRTNFLFPEAQENGIGMAALAQSSDHDDGICRSMVETNGYDCEEHMVTTKDGYILSVQRIPVGRLGGSRTTGNRPTVLLQHGLFMDGITWLLLPPGQSLALVLADNGYDVWIANSRGTKYSRRHISLNSDDPAYWNWSWDEMVAYDLPATVQYVYDQTGQKMHYVGTSLVNFEYAASFPYGSVILPKALGITSDLDYSRISVDVTPHTRHYPFWTHDRQGFVILAKFASQSSNPGPLLEGTLIAMAAFSKDQLLNMLRSAALLCPVAYMGQTTSPLSRITADNFIAETMYWFGLDEFDPFERAVIELLKVICRSSIVDCTNLFTAFTGQNCCLKPSIAHIFLDHELQPSSTKNIIHLSQMIRRGTITMYDYNDADENAKYYGQPTPPAYNMSCIPKDLPMFLSYGGADAICNVNDVKLLLGNLEDHDRDKIVVQYVEHYAHADYVMAENAKEDVYDPLIAFLATVK